MTRMATLAVRSLLRFKCVCKSWLSLISDSQFAKSHHDLAAAPTHRLLLNSSIDFKAYSVDIEAPLHDDSAKLVFNIPNSSTFSKGECSIDVVGSCRGFLLITNESVFSDYIDFIIWNPSTGFEKRFKTSWILSYVCGIGYDSSADDYVVVMVTLPLTQRSGCVQCFSSRTNSWSCIEGTAPPYMRRSHEFKNRSLLNGALHWLVDSYDDLPVIIAFDVMERRLSEIPLSQDLVVRLKTEAYNLMVMGGCLCLCFAGCKVWTMNDRYSTAPAEVWTMKKYKVQSSWTRSLVVSTTSVSLYNFLPIRFTKNGEIFRYDGYQTLMRLNDKGRLLEHRQYELYNGIYILQHGCMMYGESLLSLPGDSEKLTK